MNSAVHVYGKKFFSLALIFNALLSIVCAIGILTGFYAAHWRLYKPYLIDGTFFWAIILTAIVNIFPATNLGRVKTGRLWFHHYVYGFVVLISSSILVLTLTSISFVALFTTNITDLNINVGRFFILGGLTLVLDDLADVSRVTRFFLRVANKVAYHGRRILHIAQCIMGVVSFYIFLSVTLWLIQNPGGSTLANGIMGGTVLVTSLTSFGSVYRKIWLNLKPIKLRDIQKRLEHL